MHMNVKVLNSSSRRYNVLNHKVFMVCAFLTPTLLNGICMFTVVSRSQRGIGEECLVKFYTLTRTYEDHPRYRSIA